MAFGKLQAARDGRRSRAGPLRPHDSAVAPFADTRLHYASSGRFRAAHGRRALVAGAAVLFQCRIGKDYERSTLDNTAMLIVKLTTIDQTICHALKLSYKYFQQQFEYLVSLTILTVVVWCHR